MRPCPVVLFDRGREMRGILLSVSPLLKGGARQCCDSLPWTNLNLHHHHHHHRHDQDYGPPQTTTNHHNQPFWLEFSSIGRYQNRIKLLPFTFPPESNSNDFGFFWNQSAGSISIFVVADFFERFEFLVCSKFNHTLCGRTCACAVACTSLRSNDHVNARDTPIRRNRTPNRERTRSTVQVWSVPAEDTNDL